MHASSPAGPGLTPRRPGPVLYAMRPAAAALARPIWALLSGWLRQLTDRCQNVASKLGQSQKVTSAWRPCGRIAEYAWLHVGSLAVCGARITSVSVRLGDA